jgi:hypothetical protein
MSETEVQTLNKKVDKILYYLHNDNETGNKGLIAEFRDHKTSVDKFMEEYNTKEKVKRATAIAYTTAGGTAAIFLKWIGGLLVNHFKLW